MEIEIVKDIKTDESKCVPVGEFLYNHQNDGLYVFCPWPFPVKLSITDGLTKCQATPMFIKMPFILKKWINLDILLREIDLLKLALTGRILMHGSCYDNTLVVGFPNAGKTYQTYKAVSEGAELISEEYTIIYDKKAHPYKKIMRTCFSARTLKDCKIETSFGEKAALFFNTVRATVMPFMFEAVIWKQIPVSGKASEIKKIVYGSTGREIKNWKEFAILCENEFPFMSSEFLQAYAIASGLDLLAIQDTQRKLIKDFVESVYPNHRK